MVSGSSSRASRLTVSRLLLLVWGCFLARGLFYSAMLPIWEGFDEYCHFAYIQNVISQGNLPRAGTPVSREVEESLKLVPLPWTVRYLNLPYTTHDEYWRLTAAERQRRQEELIALPREWASQPAAQRVLIYESQQPPLYYLLLSLPLQAASDLSLPGRVMLLRLLSVVLTSLTIPLAFLAAKSVLVSAEAALGVTALIAVMPGLMVDVCRVGNDSLSVLLFTCLVLGALKFVRSPERQGPTVLLAISLALGLVTKTYFITAVPALAAIAVYDSVKRRSSNAILRMAAVLIVALLVSGWWYWRNHLLTGSWSGLMQDVTLRDVSLKKLLSQAPGVDWRNALDSTLLSHIWFGGWSFLQVRSWIYHIYRYAGLVALLGILILAGRLLLKRAAPPPWLAAPRDLLVLGGFYAFFCLGLCYHVLITFVDKGQSSSAGWYLYCLVVAEVLLVIAGLMSLMPAGLRPWVAPAASISFGLLDLYTVHFLFIPYYTGIVAHKADGALATFVVRQVPEAGFWNILGRLHANRPFLTTIGIFVIWLGYLGATLTLMALSVRAGQRHRAMR